MQKNFVRFILMCCMLLGNWNGHLALWEQGASQPEQCYPMQISALPPADQIALEAGIPVNTQQELASLLEDYLS